MGFEVLILSPNDAHVEKLENLGARCFDIEIDSKGKSIFRDLRYLINFYSFVKKTKPSLTINYTIKPVIYGALACSFANARFISVITGLGHVFTEKNFTAKLVSLLYSVSQRKALSVFFLNIQDRDFFLKEGFIRDVPNQVLPGEGVNLQRYRPRPSEVKAKEVTFLLSARMLKEKGVFEFVEAAKAVKKSFPSTKCVLLGFVDVENPSAISRSEVDNWEKQGLIEYWGVVDDVREALSKADCAVLPSYYSEGTPRSLLEASAMEIPIITTDSVGCRDVVVDGVTGFLCRPRNAESLASAMLHICEMTHEERRALGRNGRKKMMHDYDETLVLNRYKEMILRQID